MKFILNAQYFRRVILLSWIVCSQVLASDISEEQLIEQINELSLKSYHKSDGIQTAIDELFSSIDRNTYPLAWLHGFTVTERQVDVDAFMRDVDTYIQQAVDRRDLVLLFRLITWKVSALKTHSDSETAIPKTFAKGEDLCPDSSDSVWCGRLHDAWAYYYYELNDNAHALKESLKAISILKKVDLKNKFFLYDAQITLAHIFTNHGQLQQAIQLSKDNYAWFDQNDYHAEATMEATSIMGLLGKGIGVIQQGQLSKEQKNLETEVMQWLQNAELHTEKIANKERNRRTIAYTWAGVLFNLGKYEQAIQIAEKARLLYLKGDFMDYVALCGVTKARSLIRLNRLNEANNELDQAEKIVPENHKFEKMAILKARIEAAKTARNFALAFELLQTYHNNWTEQRESETKRDMNRLNAEMGLKIEEGRNETLRKENERQKEKIREAEIIRIFVVVLGILSTSTFGFLQFALRQTRRIKVSQGKMQRILDNIDEGLLTFDHSHKISDDYSKKVPEILGSSESLIGRNIMEAIFDPSHLSGEEKSILHEILAATFQEDRLAWDLNSENLCKELLFETDRDQVVELRWIPIFDTHNRLERLLLSLTDTTEKKVLEKAFGQQKRYLKALPDTLKEMLVGQPQHIARLLDATQEVLESIQASIPNTAMLRSLHTQKGIARGLGLKALSQDLHDLETTLQPRTGHSIGFGLNNQLKVVQEHLLEYRAIAEVLENSRSKSKAAFGSLAAILQVHIPAWLEQMQKGGQALHNLCINDGVLAWSDDHLLLLEQVCIHAVSNSIDHGFLESDTPIDQAEIEISVVKRQGLIHLSVSDNGQGLDLTRLEQLASARGFVPKSNETIADVVFCDGLSLAKNLGLSSGRGIGLAAVKELIEKNGGEVRLQNRQHGRGSVLKAFWPESQAY